MTDSDLSRLSIPKESVPRQRRPAWRRWGVFAALLAVVASSSGYYLFLRPLAVEIVTVSQLYPAQKLTLLNASGYVVAQRKAAVAAKITGRLTWLGVEEGSRVRRGEVIAQLEHDEAAAVRDQAAAGCEQARAQLTQAEVEERDARRQEERLRALAGEQYLSAAELDNVVARCERATAARVAATAALAAAEAALRSAAVAYDHAFIRAPFDAVVLTKNADLGDIVTPLGAAANAKASVVTIADLTSLQVEADVSEANLNRLAPGQPCEIQLDALPGQRFAGTLQTIVPTADRSKATVLVKVRFAALDPRILPEMSAKVAFLERPLAADEEQPRTVVPASALLTGAEGQILFVLDGERVRLRPVRIGAALGDQVEIASGVSAGTRIVRQPPQGLRDGRRVITAAP